jgi:hypothetical protein
MLVLGLCPIEPEHDISQYGKLPKDRKLHSLLASLGAANLLVARDAATWDEEMGANSEGL